MPISTGFTIGPFACSSSVAARPSQNCTGRYAAFHTVGAERSPCLPSTPTLTARSSSPASITLWHELHDTVAVSDSRGSKNSCLPSSTLATVVGLSAGVGGVFGRLSVALDATPATSAAAASATTIQRILMAHLPLGILRPRIAPHR